MKKRLSNGDPRLLAEWDYKGNAPLIPEDVSPNSHKVVKWVCASGHHWEAPVSQRTKGVGCPYDSGKLIAKTPKGDGHAKTKNT